MNLSQSEWAYIAGIIDGEGSIMLLKSGKNFRVTVKVVLTKRQ